MGPIFLFHFPGFFSCPAFLVAFSFSPLPSRTLFCRTPRGGPHWPRFPLAGIREGGEVAFPSPRRGSFVLFSVSSFFLYPELSALSGRVGGCPSKSFEKKPSPRPPGRIPVDHSLLTVLAVQPGTPGTTVTFMLEGLQAGCRLRGVGAAAVCHISGRAPLSHQCDAWMVRHAGWYCMQGEERTREFFVFFFDFGIFCVSFAIFSVYFRFFCAFFASHFLRFLLGKA